MFGASSSTFGGFGQQNNQQQQQQGQGQQSQPAVGLFGSSSSNNAFGTPASGSIFGQAGQQQQQQQQSSGSGTSFGGFGSGGAGAFGASSAGPIGPAFGGFGQTNANQANKVGSSFGFGSPSAITQPPQNTGFGNGTTTGLFGAGTSGQASSSTPAFGSTNPVGGMFGSVSGQPAQSNAFSGSGSIFGQSSNPPTGSNMGTSHPPFAVTSEKESGTGSAMNHFQSITCMPAYATSSFEELREQDYVQNRRYGTVGSAGSTGFGAPSATFGQQPSSGGLFGQSTQTAASSPFGQSSSGGGLFGQSSANPSSGGLFAPSNPAMTFGQSNATSTFGQNNAGPGLFGQQNNGSASNGFGNFGQQSNQQPNSSTFGQNTTSNAFGTPTASNAGGLFGAQSNSSPFGASNQNNAPKPFSFGSGSTGGFGQSSAFGSNASTPATGGLFGQNNASSTTTSGGLFGQQQTTNGGGIFGGAAAQGTGTTGGFGFGQQAQQQAQPQQQSQQPGPGAAPAFSFAGSTTNNASQPSSAQKPFTFGSAPVSTSGTFPTTQSNQAKPAFSFGGASNTINTGSNGGLFGQTQAPTTSGGLFGNSGPGQPSTGGLFGNSNTGNTSSGALFGAKPGSTSLFGGANAPAATSSPFAGTASASAPGVTGGGLFGGSFGQNNAQQGTGASLFGQGQAQAPALNASIVSGAYGSNPLFSSVQSSPTLAGSPGPVATPLLSSAVKKKPAMLPQFRLTRSPVSSARGLAYKGLNGLSNSSPAQSPKRSTMSLVDESLLLNPDAFSPRTNMKRLVVERRASSQDLLQSGTTHPEPVDAPPKDQDLSRELLIRSARDHRAESPPDSQTAPDPSSKSERAPSRSESSTTAANPFEDDQTPAALRYNSKDAATRRAEKDQITSATNDYWTSPPMPVLLDYSKAELSKVRDFKIGRRGFGQISFLQPVDLSTLEQLEDLPGDLVIFEGKVCTVYPDEDLKPVAGRGLNVPATITLERCYPLSKDKREPIRDPEHPRFQQHVDRLRRMAETEFVDYIADTGTWVFKVKHF
ncbi:hypothetical protein PYCC9005_004190 [Savitreella phatthalungensis]